MKGEQGVAGKPGKDCTPSPPGPRGLPGLQGDKLGVLTLSETNQVLQNRSQWPSRSSRRKRPRWTSCKFSELYYRV